MNQLVLLIVAALGFLAFLKKKYVAFLLAASFLAFNGFGFLGRSLERTSLDAYIFMCVSILFYQLITQRRGVKHVIGTSIIYLLVWISIRAFFSVLLGEEGFVYSIKVLRTDFFLVSFFVFAQIKDKDILMFLKYLNIIFIVVGTFFLINVMQWLITGRSSIQGQMGYNTVLGLAAPMLIYHFLMYRTNKTTFAQFLLVLLYILFVASSFSRGIIIAVAVAIAFYFVFILKTRRAVFFVVVLIPLFLFLFSFIDRNKSERVSEMTTLEEIQYATSLNSYSDFEFGSFGLRLSMVWERASYLNKHPGNLIFGVGAIHEDSPNNYFNFVVGSHKTIDGIRKKQMIDTTDVAVLSHWFRYGSIWLLLFVHFIFVSFKELKRRRCNMLALCAELILIVACVAGLSNDFFSELPMMFMPLLFLSRAYPRKQETVG